MGEQVTPGAGQELGSISEVINGDSGHMSPDAGLDEKNERSPTSDAPLSKTEKPRPHICTTCGRSFARLEHLKRHERSHTKEKPFECPDCTRCFARRDLLLRHQQKLHMTTTPSSRPKNARRESTSSSKVRKNSIVNGSASASTSTSMRPRANTISHVGGGTVGMMSGENAAPARPGPPQHGHSHHPSLGGGAGPSFDLRSIPADNRHGTLAGLSKLDTSGLSLDMSDSLRTAPVFGSFESAYGLNDMLIGHGSTINPAQLHFGGSPSVFTETPTSPFRTPFPGMPANNDQGMPEHDSVNYDWMKGFENTMTFTNESAIGGSSPSAMSTGSQSGVSEAVPDGSNHAMISSAGPWQNAMLAQTHVHPQSQPQPNQINVDFSGSIFQELCPPDTVSPKTLVGHGSTTTMADSSFATPPPQTPMTPSVLSGAENVFSHSGTGAGNVTSAHVDPFANHPAYFPPTQTQQPQPQPTYVNSITDTTRQSLMSTLQQPSGFNHRRFSQPSANASVTPPGTFSRANALDTDSYVLPSTSDLKRYVTAYVTYFHPHFPFLHIPTLDFGAPGYVNSKAKTSTGGYHESTNSANAKGDGGCLILSIAAIGALYEFDTATSRDLFECAKKMIQLYLEERRRADMSAALNSNRSTHGRDVSIHNTPLWLVQAMLLNVIYGHNCADKTAADIASTHSAALVSLARAAELTQPYVPATYQTDQTGYESSNGEVQMDSSGNGDQSESSTEELTQAKRSWLTWKTVEERKRTLYAIFALSSLLVTAYNHSPALPNSEIRVGLPCDEQFWDADSPQSWMALGGTPDMDQHSVMFADALKVLLVAGQQSQQHNQFGLTTENLKPSTFGCFVLINALHNYIWETRQRHMGKQWTNHEIEAMHVHLEPALRAWQTVWSSNPHHRVERPNPFGLGPLSADSVPLLDLAYIRLYVNLGRSKEAFWQRDWDCMTDELSRTAEVMPQVDEPLGSDFTMPNNNNNNMDSDSASPITWDSGVDYGVSDLSISNTSEATFMQHGSATNRGAPSKDERHLRTAAFYAADSLCMSDKFGSTYAEYTSRELPVQSAMCAFDSAQVLAEWVATIQDRVGPYLQGVLGQDAMDFTQVPAIMLLEDQDYTLINKIEEFLNSTESKMKENMSQFGSPGGEAFNCLPSMVEGGYATKILFATAYLLNRAGVWPVVELMAQAIEYHGARMRQRTQRSVSGYIN